MHKCQCNPRIRKHRIWRMHILYWTRHHDSGLFCKHWQTGIAHNNASQLLSFLCLIPYLIYHLRKKYIYILPEKHQTNRLNLPRITDGTLIQNPTALKTCFPVSPIRLNPLINEGNVRWKNRQLCRITSWVLANFGSDFVSQCCYHVSPVIDELTPRNRVLQMLTVVQLVKFPAFMKSEGTLLCSQEPATGTHPESSKVGPHCSIPLRPVLIL
jgi:hypothetical protein